RSLSEEFRRLTADMAARIEAEPSSANRICHQVLGRWRELLHGRRPALGPEALTGLFGELHALHQVVERDPARRIELWTGPTGAPHDLTTPSAELEVKATRRREGRFVEIHGLDQLQPPEDGTLHLLYLRVEERDQGRTVSDLVESLRSLGVDSSRLDQLLDQSGWSEDEPDDDRLAIVEERMYLVDDSFPKIVPQSFVGGAPPDGVMQLRYTVDLTGPVPRCLQTRDHEFVLQRLASIP
ncbi:MAG: PD-(D/E)XK motif protein, partial [Acidimicrobiales bacterium]